MAVSANTRRIYSIIALAIIGALVVWLFLRFIIFSGVDSPANDLKSGDLIRMKNTQTGKYLTLCSFYDPADPTNPTVSQPVVSVTAEGELDDPNAIWEVLVQPVSGSSYGEKVVAFRTPSGCAYQTCAQPTSSGLIDLVNANTGPHLYLYYDFNSNLFPSAGPGPFYQNSQVLAVADFNRQTAGPYLHQFTDNDVLDYVPKYPTKDIQLGGNIVWFSLFWWPGVSKKAAGSVGFNVWTSPANFKNGLGPVPGRSYYKNKCVLLSGNLPRVTGAAWTLEKVASRLKPPI